MKSSEIGKQSLERKRTLLAAAVAAALALPLSAQAQDAFDYEKVTLPGSVASQSFGISEPGILAGTAFLTDDDGNFIGNAPFTYDSKKDKFELIDNVAGFDSTAILAISNRGSLVGSVDDNSAQRQSGLLLDKRGNATVFDHPNAPSQTSARGINSKGIIAGLRDSSDPLQFVASFIYDSKTGIFTDIVPSLITIAQGINSEGDVVGSAIFFSENDPCNPDAPATGIVRYGWARSSEGDVRYFSVNGLATSARGVAEDGTIVGFATDPNTGETQGFVTEIGDGVCQDISVGTDDIVAFPGATENFIQSINNRGQVIGQYRDADGEQQTFIATRR
jgi:hypothetical protein